MAVDKLVDSGKLDACCAAEAAAIIAKGGGTAPLAYDFANNKGFADAIDAIPSGGAGGNYNIESVDDGDGGQILNITDAQSGMQSGIEVLEMKTYAYGSTLYRVPKKARLHASDEIWWLALANRSTNTDYAEWYHLEEFEIVVHSPVKYIESGAFARLSALKDISMLKSIEWISADVFERCTGLEGDMEFPNLEEINNYNKTNSVSYINRGGGLFSYCTGITSVSVPKLKGIYRDFCIGCTSLKTVYAPLCQYLGTHNNNRGAFFGCTALESVQLGSVGCECNVVDVYSSFQGCTQSALTITLYCTQVNADTYLAKLRAGATNATIIIKDSTTGETLVTSTPA